jgi:hypothetical protein
VKTRKLHGTYPNILYQNDQGAWFDESEEFVIAI